MTSERLQSFGASAADVELKACKNTLEVMMTIMSKQIEIMPQAAILAAGDVALTERSEQGWTAIRPLSLR